MNQNQRLNPNRDAIGGTTFGLCVAHPTHIIVDAPAIDPNIGYNAMIRPANGLISYGFIEYQFGKQLLCFLVAPLANLGAVYSSESNPSIAYREKGVAVWNSDAFCFLYHLFPLLSLRLAVPPSCTLCYNIVTCKSPPVGESLRQPRIELGYRLHGGAFQVHRVCPSTTGAGFGEGSGNCEPPSPLIPLVLIIYPNMGICQLLKQQM
jgi:hypothetical protein